MKVILDIQVPCPVSGLKLGGAICEFHKVNLMRLDNGSIMAYCPNHRARSFVSDRTTCFLISQSARVLERIEKPVKERENGSS